MDRPTPICPRESAALIAQSAKDVKISDQGVQKLSEKICEKLRDSTIRIDMFSQHELHPSPADPSAADWMFVVDTLNFCFWSPDGSHWTVSHRGKSYTGYFALCAALNRAKDEGKPIFDPLFYSKLTVKDLKDLLIGDKGSAEVPLIEDRARCLHEVGTVLLENYEGSFVNCIKACGGSAKGLLDIIVNDFPCFRDEAVLDGNQVSFYKRAQILVGDIWACFHGKGLGAFKDIDVITMFADYRVPQVLVHFDVMEYSPSLLKKLSSGEIWASGCREEIEIRGCSVHAVELVCSVVQSLLKKTGETSSYQINAILIDHFLWDFRRQNAQELSSIPFHKVISIFY